MRNITTTKNENFLEDKLYGKLFISLGKRVIP